MSWPELTAAATGKVASVDGIAFALTDFDDDFSPALAVHEFPGRAGASVTDLRRGAHPIMWRAVFAGDDYVNWMNLRDKIDAGGPHQIHHPILGNFSAYCGGFRAHHDSRRRRYCEVDLLFIQDEASGQAVFTRTTVMEPVELSRSAMTEAVETVKTETAETIANDLDGSWAEQVQAEADMAAAETEIADALGQLEDAVDQVDAALIKIDQNLNTVLAPINRALNWVDRVQSLILWRVRRILGLPGGLAGRLLYLSGRSADLVDRLSARPGRVAAMIAALVATLGAQAALTAAAELTGAALTVDSGADYVGDLVTLEADV